MATNTPAVHRIMSSSVILPTHCHFNLHLGQLFKHTLTLQSALRAVILTIHCHCSLHSGQTFIHKLSVKSVLGTDILTTHTVIAICTHGSYLTTYGHYKQERL